jgi:hypothetical protein
VFERAKTVHALDRAPTVIGFLDTYSLHNSLGIATGYGLDDRGVEVRVPVGSRILSSPFRPDRLCGPPQPPIQWIPGALSPGSEADHSPRASAEVKKMWIYTSIPPTRLSGGSAQGQFYLLPFTA